MTATRFSRLQKATALVPLALLSAAWTVNVTGLTQSSALASDTTPSTPASLPDGTTIPSQAIGAPATVSGPATSDDTVTGKNSSNIVATSTSSGIPAAALAAYQRAATVIDDADKGCHLDWTLVAAIGRVESNHGRANGNRLSSDGVSTPGIFGPALTGKNGTSRITDTDGGQFDGDTSYDRAVGPMQFIPSTWSMVGVDADGDGKRNPQDINDAALATAVYLCAGDEDLSTLAGQRAAVFRYNHSRPYVATVLGVASAYRAGDYTSVPNNTVTTDYVFTPSSPSSPNAPVHTGTTPSQGQDQGEASGGQTIAADPAPSTPTTTGDDTKGDGTKTGSGTKADQPSSPAPSSTTSDPGTAAGNLGNQVGGTVQETAASAAELTKLCTQQIASITGGAAPSEAVQKCVAQLTGQTLAQATKNVAGVVNGLTDLLKSLLGLGGLLGN